MNPLDDKYCSAKEAAQSLGVSVQTIYAYVSRGMLRSVESPDDVRRKLYFVEDVHALLRKQEVHKEPKMAARRALDWGSPVLATGVSHVQHGRLYYRGRPLETLVKTMRFEQVLSLLWIEQPDDCAWLAFDVFDALALDARFASAMGVLQSQAPLTRFCMGLPLLASVDMRAHDLSVRGFQRSGSVILAWLVRCILGEPGWTGHLAADISRAWLGDDSATALFDCALIVCAEHGLNVSTFTGRCAISAETTPYGGVMASTSALMGKRHIGIAARIEAMFNEAGSPEHLAQTIVDRMQRGDAVPGFVHPLYPEGDVRTALLFEAMKQHDAFATANGWLDASCQCSVQFYEQAYPSIDLAFVVLGRTLGLPAKASMYLFALGRVAGWIAHLMEQVQTKQLIRPRAVYVNESG